MDRRRGATLRFARRWAADRSALAALPGRPAGVLTGARFGAGDSHLGGETVIVVETSAGAVVYKPRPVSADRALADLLGRVTAGEPAGTGIRVPAVLERDGYGWSEFVPHRYCASPAELRAFYRNLGHWLAVMRLVSGTDLHGENLIACGPVPVVVDCETLFTPNYPVPPSGLGAAIDAAAAAIAGSALRSGLLPGRGTVLGWRGVDYSGGGSLPGEQPIAEVPAIHGLGTDEARMALDSVRRAPAANHPTAEPDLGRYWGEVVAGFDDYTDRLRSADARGDVADWLAPFADCTVRVVLRSTEVYAELERMLWHPVSLHDEDAARARAIGVLSAQAANLPGVPTDPAVVAAEVDDLLVGDVPLFATTPASGMLAGPGGQWGEPADLIAASLTHWRATDWPAERRAVQATVVSAYLNDGWLPTDRKMLREPVRRGGTDRRRRDLAARLVDQVAATATHGDDGTVTWVVPGLGSYGWAVQPMGADLYTGTAGVAVLLAGYEREVAAGRADPRPRVAPVLAAAVHSLRIGLDEQLRMRRDVPVRPLPPGGYVGLGGRVWAWLTLAELGAAPDGIERATTTAGLLGEAIAADDRYDLLVGMAGAIVPLLRLATMSGADGWREQAVDVGDRLLAAAKVEAGTARWTSPVAPQGLGGYAHGVTGIGWALTRLADATGADRFADLAAQAFAFEDTTWDPDHQGWRDLRWAGAHAAAWCHGAVGIGLAALDRLDRDPDRHAETVRRAAIEAWRNGFGWSHTMCHGDLGAWELVHAADLAGLAPSGVDRGLVADAVLSTVERDGPTTGLARGVFSPALLPNEGGIAYQLLRMHPDCDLPSVLVFGR